MSDLVEQYIKDCWAQMVQEARENLEGTCPLGDDEAILAMDAEINRLRAQLAERESEAVAWGYPNTALTGRSALMQVRLEIPSDDEYRGAHWIPLYTTPQPPAVPEWMPIETAPVGQKVIITYTNSAGKSRRVLAVFIPRYTEQSSGEMEEHDEYCEERDEYFICEGWYEQIDNWGEYSACHVTEGEPTHWMPLPEAPTTTLAASGEEPTNG